MRRIPIVPLFLVIGLTGLPACNPSDDDDDNPTAADFSGDWMAWTRCPGDEFESGPSKIFFTQDGDTLIFLGGTGTIRGDEMEIRFGDDVTTGTLVGDEILGETTTDGVTETFRMERFEPLGELDLTGFLKGEPIGLSVDSAAGRRSFVDPDLTELNINVIEYCDAEQFVEIVLDSNLEVGTLEVGTDTFVDVSYVNVTSEFGADETATGGELEVTSYGDEGLVGSFRLTFENGSELTGTFDVTWDLNAYVFFSDCDEEG